MLEKKSEARSKNLNRVTMVAAWVAIISALGVLFLYFLHFPKTFSKEQEVWGQFGDYVGGLLNPFFSVLGFFALLYTIRQQSEVIELQSREMASSTAQLEKSADALREQNLYYERQQFDAKLFHLMSLHSETLSGTKAVEFSPEWSKSGWREVRTEYLGTSAIRFSFMKLVGESFNEIRMGQGLDTLGDMEIAFKKWKFTHGAPLSRYFGSIRNLVRFISSGPRDDKGFAVELLRSQLGSDEQRLLLYACTLDESMRQSLRFFHLNGFGSDVVDGDGFAQDLAEIISFRMYGAFI